MLVGLLILVLCLSALTNHLCLACWPLLLTCALLLTFAMLTGLYYSLGYTSRSLLLTYAINTKILMNRPIYTFNVLPYHILALTQENLSSGSVTRLGSNQSVGLQRRARLLKFYML